MINKYETIFIINPEYTEEDTQSLIEKIKNIIETSGELENVDEWGKRKLAYPIDDHNDGYYVLIEFGAKSSLPQELERIYRITDGIIKYIIIKKDN
ncbi:MAG: 30S ribosomal protein S6 [Clostridium sp.]|mgnify:CR=1 FL=1|nr:30S ribosomal protein S6 [Clostridium sp.]